MRFRGARSALIATAVLAALAIPGTMLLVLKPVPSATTISVPLPVERAGDYDDHKAQLANRIAMATPAASPESTRAVEAPLSALAAPRSQPLPPAPPVGGVPSFSHVFVIVMENHEYGSVIGSPAAPFINSLAASYGLATNYYGASHPSLPNYLALSGGSTFGIASDCTTCTVNGINLGDQLEASGRTWKAYLEDMPAPCYLGASAGNYAMKHNPFVYYNGIRNNPARCAAHVVPFTQFGADITTGQVPNFAWITPNMCNDTHDCGVAVGDAWLANVVSMITGSAAYRNGGVLFITWDEGSSGAGCCGDSWGGHVATLVIAPSAIRGFRSGIAENHYGLLRTIEDGFHLPHLGAAGWSSNVALREYFQN